MSTSNLRTFKCPSCNAPLETDGRQRTIKCKYCGHTVEAPQEPKPTTVVITAPPPHLPSPPSRRVGGVIGCIVAGVVLVVVISAAVPLFGTLAVLNSVVPTVQNLSDLPNIVQTVQANVVTAPPLTVNDAHVLPPVGDGVVDVLASTYDSADNTYALAYVDSAAHTLRWRGQAIDSSRISQLKVAADSNSVYMVDGTRLLALNRADGGAVWQASLKDEISPACEGCLRVLSERVIALTKDGALQAFDAQTGRAAWSRRLTATPDRLFVMGENVVVIDKLAEGNEGVVKLINAATGDLVQQVEPRGPNQPFPEDLQALELYSPVVVDPQANAFYAIVGFFEPTTIQRWDLARNEMLWQAVAGRDVIKTTTSQLKPVLAADSLYIGDGDHIVAVATADGAPRQLPGEPDYELTPLTARDGVLVVSAKRTRGTERFEIWGLEAQSGERLWEYVPEAKKLAENESFDMRLWSSSDEGAWTWRLGGEGFLLLQALSEPKRFTIETLNLKDGVSGGPTVLDLKLSASGTNFVNLAAWNTRQAWLIADSRIQVFDLGTGAAEYVWP